MKPVLIVYASREGHTKRIADHLARNLNAELLEAKHAPPGISLDNYSAAIVAASVHVGRHENEIVSFVKAHLRELDRIPSVFLSVSLSEAGAEDPSATPDRRAQAAADVQRMIDVFLESTGWNPWRIQAVAGALMYSKYNFLLRWIMKRTAARAGGSTDTSRDHVYTDWAALDRLALDVAKPQSSPERESSTREGHLSRR